MRRKIKQTVLPPRITESPCGKLEDVVAKDYREEYSEVVLCTQQQVLQAVLTNESRAVNTS